MAKKRVVENGMAYLRGRGDWREAVPVFRDWASEVEREDLALGSWKAVRRRRVWAESGGTETQWHAGCRGRAGECERLLHRYPRDGVEFGSFLTNDRTKMTKGPVKRVLRVLH